ncbi:MAG TPA: hypothetical protein VI757_14740 [Bacteroidia bacterium]|nr:hypothetical protein [Bacteroidia bacterium]
MKNILIVIAAIAVMSFSSCSVGAGVQISASDNKTPRDSVKTAADSNSIQRDSLQSPVNHEPVK